MLGAGLSWCSVAELTHAADSTFPTLYNTEKEPNAQPMPPQDALAALHLPEGFGATLFAAEPEVQNPVAMAWDARGRMWVAENYTYAERSTRFALDLRDRVLILEDKDGDGRADSRKVFTDEVQILTSVEVGRGGVWLMCPPQVLFIPDRDGDDVPDGAPEVVLDGFTVADSNYHNFANGLRWGPDGWLYGRCGHSCPGKIGVPGTPEKDRVPIEGGVWRFDPERKVVEVLSHGTTNPWGHDWDRHGEGFFINTVNGHLWHLIPGAHYKESFGADPNPGVYERLDMHADHWHFDTSGNWSDSRDGKANQFGGGHAHIGMMIYQGDQWPEEWQNRLYTLNMHGRRANVERLERTGSGYVGRHQADIFLSDDPWFRGIDIRTGPDGSAYILDWSDTGECHEATGVHRTSGRIFKISHGQPEKPDLSDLQTLSPEGVSRILSQTNPWQDRRLRIQLAATGAAPEIESLLLQTARDETADTVTRLRALWHLHAAGITKPSEWEALLTTLLDAPDEHLRVWAIRLLTDNWPLDTITGPVPGADYPDKPTLRERFTDLAKTDASGLVRLTLASTLQRLPVKGRTPLGLALAAHAEDAEDHNLPAMVWYGLIPLGDSDPLALVEVAKVCEWPSTLRWIARNLATRVEDEPKPLNALLTYAAKAEPAKQLSLLRGVSDGFQGWRKAPKPASWDALTAAIGNSKSADPALNGLVTELGAVFGDGRALDAVKKVALDDSAEITMRVAALETLIDSRPPDLKELCVSLLDARILNATAVKGLALYDDPALGASLAQRYKKFQPESRPSVIDVLVSRPAFAGALLDQVKKGAIPRADLTAFHARQIRAFEDPELTEKLTAVWGELRESSEDKRQLVATLKTQLTPDTLAQANLSQGRLLFTGICGACHTLYGQGGKVGPDLTGSGRANLDYLLENISDPSAEVSADYRMSLLTLKDERVLSGVIASETDRTLTLRQLTEEMTVEKEQIAKRETSPYSMMPEGLLLALQPDQIRDLAAYLMNPVQVPLPE